MITRFRSGLGWAAAIGALAGCTGTPDAGTTSPVSSEAKATPVAEAKAVTPSVEKPAAHPKFDADLAFASLKKQCDFGPRYLGAPGHGKCLDYLKAEMKKYADSTVLQEFQYRGMPVTNVVGVFNPEGKTEPSSAPIVLLAHWDTRPIADGPNSKALKSGPAFQYGPKGWNRLAPILGASDGASGVAVLLELARLFKEKRPTVGVLLVLVDGEDYGDFRAKGGQGDGVLLGAEYFAKNYRKTPAFGTPFNGILLDMVGGKNLVIAKELNSQNAAPGMNDKIFSVAQSLQHDDVFLYNEVQEVEDDHTPLIREGIPTVDVIHPLPYGNFETRGYVQWHTQEDSPENCSAKALKAVGETIAEVMYREK